MVLANVRYMLLMNWAMGMDELKHGCKGSEVNFPDPNIDWTKHFFDELSVDEWVKAKLQLGTKKSSGEKSEGANQSLSKKKLGIPVLDNLIELGVDEILVQIKAIEFKRHCLLTEYTDIDTMTKHWLWFPISALSKIKTKIEPNAVSFLPQTVTRKFKGTLDNTIIAQARQSLVKFVLEFS